MEPNLLCSWLCGLLDFSHLAPVGTGWSLGGRALRGKVFMVLLPRKGRQPVSGLFQGLRWGPRADGLSSPMRPETESPRAGGGGVLGPAAAPKPLCSQQKQDWMSL